MKRTDEELIGACLAGDATAWAALIERYQKLVYSIPRRYRLPPEEAADVFQGVWVDLYRGLAGLRRAGGIRSWLVTATMRRCLLHKKRRERQAAQSIDLAAPRLADPAPDPLAIREEAERAQGIRDAVESLPPRCRELVRMLFFEEPQRPYAEVAKKLGLAEGSIGFIRGRCLERLRKALAEEPKKADE